ncbi:MAG: hypothetical protein A2600_06300 [Candidatus Lambdaproteobacteria bacterium RIFOXYD1_FULL_56_27]|uniref:Uncharacterized protein n=1 Tax=Candidatus Lambdaproteobacteria bacterium RIFOXYD2_FULL_56_26 TaxID=1817773 RepID=A0A1F6GLB9_9PROT|nr:MAG: hypothetical protein A2557_12900 [Candidatus Lambdaproteobacteria bacterium RIFOXYD2_FULL_56_26]OGH05497.1 MAG: hypothetical protein A2426_03870 [Candidatus Lambdaproteobacteria bacterium RIFOXYC1_FULL_56_13]OGH09788.1 MAG: hypothetical protein A2600_06300 [Candidatus Lambdaproteobacteria bacterium RIFOXYD1_FULL_56_27]
MNASHQFSETVERFVKMQRKKRIIAHERDITLVDLVAQLEPVSVEQVLAGFELLNQELPMAADFLRQIKESFIEAVRSLNRLNPSRRFFALETFNYLGDLDRLTLVTETLLFGQDSQIRPIALNFLHAFPGTDQVINTLLSHKELFDPKTIDSHHHALNAFRYDMAEKLLTLLHQDFVLLQAKSAGIEPELSLDLLRQIVRHHSPAKLSLHLISGQQLSINLAKLIAYIQGHKMMPVYAKKRSDFLKGFVTELSTPGKIEGVQPEDMSKVVACFLYTNEQLAPPEPLIKRLVSEDQFGDPKTELAQKEFLDQLAPTTLDMVLKDLRDFLVELNKTPMADLEAAFLVAQNKYLSGQRNEDSLFGRVHDALEDLKATGILILENLLNLFKGIKSALSGGPKGTQGGKKSLDELFDELPEAGDLEEFRVILRDPGCKERAKEYVQVETSEVGYRAAMTDGGKRGASVNLQLFRTQENLADFKEAFLLLLKQLGQQPASTLVTNEFKHPQATDSVEEFYLPLLVPMDGQDPILFCLGVGYFEKEIQWSGSEENAKTVADAYMDPYCFLMHIQNRDTTMNARSRKLLTDIKGLKQKEFKAINLRGQAYAQACLSILLDLLHLVTEAEWDSKPVQKLVAFLYEQLKLKPEYF